MSYIEYNEPIEVVCPTCRKTLQVVPGHNAARHVVAADAPCRACLEAQLAGAVDLLRWALPYLPAPLPSMEGGAYAENYDRAMTLSANTPTGGQ